MPSRPEPSQLSTTRTTRASGAHELQPWLGRPRLRPWVDRWLADPARTLRRRIAKAKPAALPLADLWSAWAVADLECALALRAWQLAPRRDKRAPFEVYRAALEREALIAGELRLRTTR